MIHTSLWICYIFTWNIQRLGTCGFTIHEMIFTYQKGKYLGAHGSWFRLGGVKKEMAPERLKGVETFLTALNTYCLNLHGI